MSTYCQVERNWWNDERVRPLPRDGKLAWSFMMCNPQDHYSGVYSLSLAAAAEHLDMTVDEFSHWLDVFHDLGLIVWDARARVVWVRNKFRHQCGETPGVKLVSGAKRWIRSMPKTEIVGAFAAFYFGSPAAESVTPMGISGSPTGIDRVLSGSCSGSVSDSVSDQTAEVEATGPSQPSSGAAPPEPSANTPPPPVPPLVAPLPRGRTRLSASAWAHEFRYTLESTPAAKRVQQTPLGSVRAAAGIEQALEFYGPERVERVALWTQEQAALHRETDGKRGIDPRLYACMFVGDGFGARLEAYEQHIESERRRLAVQRSDAALVSAEVPTLTPEKQAEIDAFALECFGRRQHAN